MKVKNFTAIALRCSHCGNIEKKHINLFEYSAGKERVIRCSSCNRVVCVMKADNKKRYRIELSCAVCGSRHRLTVPISEFWHTSEKKFYCSLTDEPVFAVGFDKNVDAILSQSLSAASFRDEMEAEAEAGDDADALFERLSRADGAFRDAEELFECLEHIRYLSEEGLVNCDCRSNAIQLQVEEDGFRIICSRCEREDFLDFSSRESIEAIKNLSEIHLI